MKQMKAKITSGGYGIKRNDSFSILKYKGKIKIITREMS